MISNSNYQLKFSPRNARADIAKLQSQDRRAIRYNQILKPSSPQPVSNWRNYLTNEANYNDDTSSSKNSARHASPSYYHPRNNFEPEYADRNGQQQSRVKSILSNRREEQNKRKQDIIRRVKQLQDKVLPMVEGEHYSDERQNYDFAWQARMEQKIVRLQTSIDSIKKEMEINMEKRLIEVESKWENRFNELVRAVEQL